MQIAEDGTFIRKIGKKGRGPGEWGYYAPRAIAVKNQSLLVLGPGRKTLFYHEAGQFIHSFKIKPYQIGGAGIPAYSFGFTHEEILIQAWPATRRLASLYDFSGEHKGYVGKILPVMPEYLKVNPAMNDTLWVRDKSHYYCLFVHRPILRKYDANHKKVAEFKVAGPEVDRYEEVFFKNKKDPNWTYPKPHFTDLKVFGGYLYLMCDGVLYQLDKQTGKVLTRTIFFGTGSLEHLNNKEHKLFFMFAAFFDSGKFVLGHRGLLPDHDLGTAVLPFPTRKQKK